MRRGAILLVLLFIAVVLIDMYFKKGQGRYMEVRKSDIVIGKSEKSKNQKNIAVKADIENIADESKTEEETSVIKNQPTVSERLSELGANIGDPIFIRIFKYSAELEMWIKVGGKYELLQTYEICRQSGYLGPKLKEGDRQEPEGFYYVGKNRLNPNSKFHLAFNIGYPNKYDRAHKRNGSAIMVHGSCVTVGCFPMTDEKIEEIYELVESALDNGQRFVRVHIFPFRMTEKKMEQYQDNKWYPFWSNLKEGYDYFEEKKIPPNVNVKNLKYVFE